MAQKIFQGTWEEIQQNYSSELSGHRVRLVLLSDEAPLPDETPLTVLSESANHRRGMGKYSHVPGTSEDFAREKEREIAREDAL